MGKMNHKQFCYWLRGIASVKNGDGISNEEWQIIVDKLNQTFIEKNECEPILTHQNTPPSIAYPYVYYVNPCFYHHDFYRVTC